MFEEIKAPDSERNSRTSENVILSPMTPSLEIWPARSSHLELNSFPEALRLMLCKVRILGNEASLPVKTAHPFCLSSPGGFRPSPENPTWPGPAFIEALAVGTRGWVPSVSLWELPCAPLDQTTARAGGWAARAGQAYSVLPVRTTHLPGHLPSVFLTPASTRSPFPYHSQSPPCCHCPTAEMLSFPFKII